MIRCLRIIADRYLVLGTWYLDSEAITDQSVMQSEDSVSEPGQLRKQLVNFIQHAKAGCKLELTFEFGRRSDGHTEETSHLLGATSTCSFGDVGTDRDRRRSYLPSQPEALLRGKKRSDPVGSLSNLHCLSPNLEPPKVVHLETNTGPGNRLAPLWSKYSVPSTEYRLFLGSSR